MALDLESLKSQERNVMSYKCFIFFKYPDIMQING